MAFQHLYDKVAAEHRQDLQREARQRHLLAGLPRHHLSMGRIVGRLGALLVALGSRMEQIEQRNNASVYSMAARQK